MPIMGRRAAWSVLRVTLVVPLLFVTVLASVKGCAGGLERHVFQDAAVPADSGVLEQGVTPDAKPIKPTPPKCKPGFGTGDACGGDVTGTWSYHSGCVDPKNINGYSTLLSSCAGATLKTASFVLGTGANVLVLKADKSFSRALKGSVSGGFILPKACMAAVGSCQTLTSLIKSILGMSTVQCKSASGGCDCDFTITVDKQEQGSYSTSGSSATLVTAGKSYVYNYCSKNGALQYRGADTNKDDQLVSLVLVR